MEAMLKMKRIDMAEVERAAGGPAGGGSLTRERETGNVGGREDERLPGLLLVVRATSSS